jgi:tRNA (Thr-GGU) A37 N-methylase
MTPIGTVSSPRTEAIDDNWDAIDDTPVLDITPYLQEFAPRGDIRQPQWSHELMQRYWS